MDHDLTLLSWGGKIPIVFVLAASDVAQLHPPSPRYVLASRMAYLPRLAEEATHAFRQAVAPSGGGSQNIWFEACGIPLKWQLPIGVLVDAVRTQATPISPLPFQIVIHFHDFPSDKILACSGPDMSKWSYINSLKQSTCLRFGEVKKVLTGLSEIQREQMWNALAVGNYHDFSKCNDMLHGVRCQEKGKRRCIRVVGVVSHNNNENTRATSPGKKDSTEESKGTDNNTGGTLRNVLRPLEITEEMKEGTVTLQSFLNVEENNDKGSAIMVHGVEIPLQADVVELHEMLASADNCLYIVLCGKYLNEVLR